MEWEENDGGRASYHHGEGGDCAVRALAIAAKIDYMDAAQEIQEVIDVERGKKNRKTGKYDRRSNVRTGVFMTTMKRAMENRGWKWTPTMGIGTGCTVHVCAEELPEGRIILRLSKHYAAVIDGVLNDTGDCSRDETRCVYGYWSAK
jgi:hypothetical protein